MPRKACSVQYDLKLFRTHLKTAWNLLEEWQHNLENEHRNDRDGLLHERFGCQKERRDKKMRDRGESCSEETLRNAIRIQGKFKESMSSLRKYESHTATDDTKKLHQEALRMRILNKINLKLLATFFKRSDVQKETRDLNEHFAENNVQKPEAPKISDQENNKSPVEKPVPIKIESPSVRKNYVNADKTVHQKPNKPPTTKSVLKPWSWHKLETPKEQEESDNLNSNPLLSSGKVSSMQIHLSPPPGLSLPCPVGNVHPSQNGVGRINDKNMCLSVICCHYETNVLGTLRFMERGEQIIITERLSHDVAQIYRPRNGSSGMLPAKIISCIDDKKWTRLHTLPLGMCMYLNDNYYFPPWSMESLCGFMLKIDETVVLAEELAPQQTQVLVSLPSSLQVQSSVQSFYMLPVDVLSPQRSMNVHSWLFDQANP